MKEDFEDEMNESLKEIQENRIKQIEVFKEQRNKSRKDIHENKTKQEKEINKSLRLENGNRIKNKKQKIQTDRILEMENLG